MSSVGDAVPLARKSDDRPRTWHPSWIFLLCSPFHHLPVVSTPAACTARTNPPRRGRWRPARRTGQRRRRRVEPSSTKLAVAAKSEQDIGIRPRLANQRSGAPTSHGMQRSAASRPRPGVEGKRNGIRGWTVFEIPSTLGSESAVGLSACGPDRGQGSHAHGIGRRPRSFGRRGSWEVPRG
ncbi:hypothetical protein PVAP13_7NG359040 [Panicum virgatum]|uniref:Uncharacterized protein n=1 Tax=Panicum virgatum TaxID=38727 RepID=A0A8T0QB29_PANVG|nr:hypothetical protein PVAP13_7NG359040 [Panicum virgatum]